MSLFLVTLLVPDYDAGLAFFVHGLGWTCVEDIDQGRKRWVTVAPPGGETRLLLSLPTTGAQQAALGRQTGDRVGLFLRTDAFDRDVARIVEAGGTLLETPRQEPYGRVVQWQDPWGNRWDLLQPA